MPIRLAAAVASVVVAASVRYGLTVVLDARHPFMPFLIAVAFSAWLGGVRPALVALVLGALTVAVAVPPPGGLRADGGPSYLAGFAMFLGTGLAITLLGGSMRVAQERAAEKSAEAECALEGERARREQLRVTLQSIADGVLVTDKGGNVRSLNRVAERLTGWSDAAAEGQPLRAVFRTVDDLTRRTAEVPVVAVMQDGAPAHTDDHSILIARDGTARPIEHSTAALKDDRGGITGVVITFRDIAERQGAEQALRENEQRFRQLADAMPQIVWIARADHSIESLNRRWFDYTGLSPEESYQPDGWKAAVHPDDLDRVAAARARADETGEPFEAEYRLRDRAGVYRWHLGRSVPIADESGRVLHRFGTSTDIDDRKRAEHAARFLADASAKLAGLVDEASTLREVARFAVPFFADWCAVDLLDADGTLGRLEVAHVDPDRAARGRELHRRYPFRPGMPTGVARVVASGRPLLVPEITPAMLAAHAQDDDHLRTLLALGLRSYLCVPLQGQSGTLGALSFVSSESGRVYSEDDLRLAEDLAHRAAIAIDNARLYARLTEADRRKDEFLATLAHELRNPLAPIRNALHLLDRPDFEGAGRVEVRAVIRRQVDHLTRLVDDLLDMSRINQGKVELRTEAVDLSALVGRALESCRPLVEDQGHTLTVALPPGPLLLDADPTRLGQVLDNLLNNAAKYTDPGGRIALTIERDLAAGALVIRVCDTGIGIDPEKLPRIFELFVQGERRLDRSQGGLGIGLSLVKSLVGLHGGTVTAHSAGLGCGSEFVVRLPALPDGRGVALPRADGAAAAARPGALPRRRVLVVDDNLDAARTLAMLLKRSWGQLVEVAHDGPAALEAARAFHPDVILLDIGLPGMTGYEVARRLRAEPEFAPTAIVAMTGWGQEEDRRRSQEAGIDHHLVKPVDPDDLHRLLAALEEKTGSRAKGATMA